MTDQIEFNFSECDWAYRNKNFRKLDQLLSNIIRQDPEHFEANHRLGKLALELGKYGPGLRFNKQASRSGDPEALECYLSNLFYLEEFEEFKIELARFCILSLIKSQPICLTPNTLKQLTKSAESKIHMQFFGSGDKKSSKQHNRVTDLVSQEEQLAEGIKTKLQKIRELLSKHKLNEATQLAKDILKIQPSNLIALNLTGTAFALKKDFKNAENYFLKSLNLAPAHKDASINLSNVYLEMGNLGQSLTVLNEMLDRFPEFRSGYIQRARVLKLRNLKGDALLDYFCALNLETHDEVALFEIAEIFRELNELDLTEIILKKCKADSPTWIKPLINLSELFIYKGDYRKSLRYAEDALKIDNTSFQALFNSAVASEQLNRPNDTEKYLLLALAANKDSVDTYHKLGNHYYREKKYQQACKTYLDGIGINPKNVEILNNLAACQLKLGGLDKAVRYFEAVLSINPNFEHTVENLQSILIQTQSPLLSKYESLFSDYTVKLLKPKMYINSAILSFIRGELLETTQALISFKNLNAETKQVLHPNDVTFCNAYTKFLTALVTDPMQRNAINQHSESLYHLGDSHCLSFCHQQVRCKNGLGIITPRITFGGKAYHFSEPNNNEFKAITEYNLSNIPPSSSVLVSFGEIDCRIEEGILPAAKYNLSNAKKLVDETVKGYVAWFCNMANKYNVHLNFVNVYAPVHIKTASTEDNILREKIIKYYNEKLSDYVGGTVHNLVDMYSHTDGGTGKSNNKFHIDEFHLGPGALTALQTELLNTSCRS